MLGPHAPTHDPQPGLQNVPAIQDSNFEIPETHNSQELEPPLRSNHRQLPRHPPRQVSGRRLAAVYQGILQGILRFQWLRGLFSSKKPLCRSDFSCNSLRELTGKILQRSGNLLAVTGNCSRKSVSVHFSHTCLFKVRTRSVLTEKFSGGGRDVASSRTLRRGFLAGAPRGLGSKRA